MHTGIIISVLVVASDPLHIFPCPILNFALNCPRKHRESSKVTQRLSLHKLINDLKIPQRYYSEGKCIWAALKMILEWFILKPAVFPELLSCNRIYLQRG